MFRTAGAGQFFTAKRAARIKRASRSKIASFELTPAILSTHLFWTMGAREGEPGEARGGTAGPVFKIFESRISQINLLMIGLIVVWPEGVLVPKSQQTIGEGTSLMKIIFAASPFQAEAGSMVVCRTAGVHRQMCNVKVCK